MSMRRLLICALLLVAACGSDPTSLGATPTEEPSVTAADPRDLLGRWKVTGAGVLAGTTLTLRDSSSIDDALVLDLPCGQVGGTWEAAGEPSLFTGDVYAGKQACFGDKGIRDVEWLRLAAGFRLGTGGPDLLGSNGELVATLRRVASPPAASPGAGLGQDFSEPAGLPSGAKPPTSEQLQRRWVPVGTAKTTSFAEFTGDRRWQGSDGCNGSSGQFVLGREGRLLATNGPTTLIGCAGSALPYWVTQSGRVGLIGDELVFYDAKAKELGRAVAG